MIKMSLDIGVNADHELRSPQLKEYKIKHVLHGRVRTTLNDLSKFKDNYSQATNKLDINKTKIETYKYIEPTNKWNYYLHRPISHLFKSHVIQYAINNNIEELLTNTISCYKQTMTPCGVSILCRKDGVVRTLLMRIPPPAVEGTGYVPDFLEKDEHEYLLDIYNNMEWGKVHSFKLSSTSLDLDVVKKHTNIEERLKKHFKNFEIHM